ncbi:cation-translocating P-type ATPase [Ornithinimicrobium cryptoxanthini]|uniref:Cation-translocating P-type ATPase n=1 Tax=Ornithinimicrobium cryptoxanthini TaxID=2934161 RepID=A0ABY4YI25_9MICO|nr:cation-translocating P-type ATPase [Ornithinimicrobium cryptoxanthini]USQ75822.1 cation-translocating P-type ATPase [Ornithinimicrobium cryptoxanthini]
MAAIQGNPSTTELAEVVSAVDTDPERGLTQVEAAARLDSDGPNELRSAPPVPTWRKVLAQFQDPLIYLLLAAVVIATFAWVVEGANGLPTDSIVITLIVIANAILGYSQEARAEEAVAALQRMTASHATVVRDGRTQLVPASDLVRGDLLVLAEGDSIGADARVVQANALRVAEASLTGESTAVTKRPGVLAGGEPLGDRTNMVFKGTAVTQGTGRTVVTGTAMDTEMGAIATMLEQTQREPTPLEREIALIGKMLGAIVIVIAAVVMGTVWLISGVNTLDDAVTVLLLGVSLAVAAVPEGLPAILSVVLSIGVQRMAQRNAIVKNLSSVETLGSASVICSDKTGTLTNNEMTLQTVLTSSGTAEVTGVGYRPEGDVIANGVVLAATTEGGGGGLEAQRAEDVVVLAGGSLASNSELREEDGEWQILGDPTEAAFLVAERKMGLTERRTARFTRVGEVPFTSERKRMSTLHLDHEHDDRPVLISKGAPDILLQRCTAVRDGLQTRPLDEGTRAAILADVEVLSGRAMRTMGVAYRSLRVEEVGVEAIASGQVPAEAAEQLEHDLVYVGTVGMIDPPRDSAGEAVREAHRAGIRVVMITGDHPSTALRIAQDLGIAEEGAEAVTGIDLDALDRPGFADVVSRVNVFARVAPEHKLRIVDALQEAGEIVAMTGDGVNDAPALKSADIGVAMGITGTEVTKEAGSMILADDNFATIVAAVRQGRVIFDNIKKFLRYLLSSNMGEVLTVFLGVVLAGVIGLTAASQDAVVLPLLATQILWINLVTDSAPALALGVDPETDDVMARRPRAVGERVIDARMWGGIVAVGAVMAVATLLTIDIFLPGGLVEGSDTLEVARTAGFTTLVLAQLYNVFNSRSQTTSAFHGLLSNRWLLAAVAFGVASQVAVVHLPVLQQAFGTASLDLWHWLVCAVMASSVLWFDEALKFVERRLDARRAVVR